MQRTMIFLFLHMLLAMPVFAQDTAGIYQEQMPTPMSFDETNAWVTGYEMRVSKYMEGKYSPVISAVTVDGDTIDPVGLKDKVVVLNFWYNGCLPCLAEIPHLNALAEKYNGKDVVFIAVTNDSIETIQKFRSKHPFLFKMISSEKITAAFNVQSFPTTVIIDRNGVIKKYNTGAFTDGKKDQNTTLINYYSAMIDKALEKK